MEHRPIPLLYSEGLGQAGNVASLNYSLFLCLVLLFVGGRVLEEEFRPHFTEKGMRTEA